MNRRSVLVCGISGLVVGIALGFADAYVPCHAVLFICLLAGVVGVLMMAWAVSYEDAGDALGVLNRNLDRLHAIVVSEPRWHCFRLGFSLLVLGQGASATSTLLGTSRPVLLVYELNWVALGAIGTTAAAMMAVTPLIMRFVASWRRRRTLRRRFISLIATVAPELDRLLSQSGDDLEVEFGPKAQGAVEQFERLALHASELSRREDRLIADLAEQLGWIHGVQLQRQAGDPSRAKRVWVEDTRERARSAKALLHERCPV